MQRRSFLLSSSALLAAQDRVRMGVIGAGGRGRFLTGEFKEIGALMNAVCDVYEPNLTAGLAAASTGARGYTDYRQLLENKDIDAVLVATPDHWHAQMVIDAVEAGKDVYVEKPMCHTVDEGYRMVEAVRRTKRVVTVGTQRRSSPLFQEAAKFVTPERLGDVRLVTSWWLNHQRGLSDRKIEGKLDWKQWLGPAPARPLEDKVLFNWYYFWDFSGGLLIGQAAHMLDAIQWFMRADAPVAVTCAGGQVNLAGAEIPDTASVTLEYANNFIATFTLGYKAMRYHFHSDQLAQYHGSRARFDVGREHYELYDENPKEMELKPAVSVNKPGSFGPATRDHIRNFLDCIRTRRDPTAPVEEGLKTAIALIMTIESLRKGRRVRWNAALRQMES
ncbi:MAG: Gfo/Idh/MocA family oxidoreductase [Bryobacteraceae bacterium]|nr:Gfo/Idh/MocA family oxidoreductase [Bryobacteraceae bacterium]